MSDGHLSISRTKLSPRKRLKTLLLPFDLLNLYFLWYRRRQNYVTSTDGFNCDFNCKWAIADHCKRNDNIMNLIGRQSLSGHLAAPIRTQFKRLSSELGFDATYYQILLQFAENVSSSDKGAVIFVLTRTLNGPLHSVLNRTQQTSEMKYFRVFVRVSKQLQTTEVV